MILNIDHITINVIIQPQEPVHEVVLVNETPRLQEPFKRGHRTPEEIQARLELVESRQLALHKRAERLQRRLLIAAKLRAIVGDETANSILGGTF